jgi:hypothetical protein
VPTEKSWGQGSYTFLAMVERELSSDFIGGIYCSLGGSHLLGPRARMHTSHALLACTRPPLGRAPELRLPCIYRTRMPLLGVLCRRVRFWGAYLGEWPTQCRMEPAAAGARPSRAAGYPPSASQDAIGSIAAWHTRGRAPAASRWPIAREIAFRPPRGPRPKQGPLRQCRRGEGIRNSPIPPLEGLHQSVNKHTF